MKMLKIIFLFVICFRFPFAVPQKSVKTESCEDMAMNAGHRFRFFNSPNYPGRFAEQTQCNWIIRAPNGYRVELTFDAFYLLGAVAGKAGANFCVHQHVRLQDIFSGMSDGPYCGNTYPPTSISTGRVLRVTLESNAKGMGQPFYKGFQASYRVSRQASSIRLRDPDGKWLSYTVIGGDRVVTTTSTTTIATVPTRNPNEVDDNNNAEIDAVNNKANSKNVNNNDEVNKRNNIINVPPVPYLPPSRKRRPTRPPRIVKRTTTQPPPAYIAQTRPPQVLYLPEKPRVTVIDYTKEREDSGMSTGGKVGISVGVLIVIAIVILIIYFALRKRRLHKDQSEKTTKTKTQSEIKQEVKKSKATYEKKSKPASPKRSKSHDSCHTISEAKTSSRRHHHGNKHHERNKHSKVEKSSHFNGHHRGHRETSLPGHEGSSKLNTLKHSKHRSGTESGPRKTHGGHRKHRSNRK